MKFHCLVLLLIVLVSTYRSTCVSGLRFIQEVTGPTDLGDHDFFAAKNVITEKAALQTRIGNSITAFVPPAIQSLYTEAIDDVVHSMGDEYTQRVIDMHEYALASSAILAEVLEKANRSKIESALAGLNRVFAERNMSKYPPAFDDTFTKANKMVDWFVESAQHSWTNGVDLPIPKEAPPQLYAEVHKTKLPRLDVASLAKAFDATTDNLIQATAEIHVSEPLFHNSSKEEIHKAMDALVAAVRPLSLLLNSNSQVYAFALTSLMAELRMTNRDYCSGTQTTTENCSSLWTSISTCPDTSSSGGVPYLSTFWYNERCNNLWTPQFHYTETLVSLLSIRAKPAFSTMRFFQNVVTQGPAHTGVGKSAIINFAFELQIRPDRWTSMIYKLGNNFVKRPIQHAQWLSYITTYHIAALQ